MGYDKEQIQRSKKAYSVLKSLNKSSEYPAKLSRKLGISDGSIRNILRELKKISVVEKGKKIEDKNIRYYEINISGFFDLWVEELKKLADEKRKKIPEYIDLSNYENLKKDTERSEIPLLIFALSYGVDDFNIKDLVMGYFTNYLEEQETSTLNEMLFEEMKRSISLFSSILDETGIEVKSIQKLRDLFFWLFREEYLSSSKFMMLSMVENTDIKEENLAKINSKLIFKLIK